MAAGELAGPDEVRRFRSEAQKAAKLAHPNVLPIYEVGEQTGRPFFSMKLVPEGGLDRHLRTVANRPDKIAGLMAKLARAIDLAHRVGLIHRDLKPANVLLDADGTPYVAVLGAGQVGRRRGRADAVRGDRRHVGLHGPEQTRGEKAPTVAVDVDALGAVLYELITGRPSVADGRCSGPSADGRRIVGR
jgi:serine/threonine-protein kinase